MGTWDKQHNEVPSVGKRLGCGQPGQRAGCLPELGEGGGQAVPHQGGADQAARHLHEELQPDGRAQQGVRRRSAELGLGIPQYPEQNMTSSPSPHFTAAAPSSFDWRDHGVVSPIKNQRQCGSCAAFAAVATIESCFAQKTGVITDLSEEHLVNCYATDGCEGWWANRYMESIVSQNGGNLEQEYCCPYTATDNHCNDDNSCDYTVASISGHYISWYPRETDMAAHVASVGPAATYIYANYLFDYSYGIFDDPNCCEETTDSDCKNTYNHAVTAVGYGSEGGQDFWIVKNQWGTSWGENGFFRIKRGTGHCGFGINHYLTPHCG